VDLDQFLRRPLLAVTDSDVLERLIRRNGQGLVRRFVAGEDLDAALNVVRRIFDQGMTVTLDQLGENVTTGDEARAAVGSYVDILRRMHESGFEPNISVKLTMLGLDLSDDLALQSMRPILETAREVAGFVRIDMEGSAYTERTLAIADALHGEFPSIVGTVIQSYLRRSEGDVERLIDRGIRVRLVKGAYAEPAAIAYRDRKEIDAAYARLARRLLATGLYPAFGTHDPALIRDVQEVARQWGIARDRFEFQMLYGVRRDAQTALVRDGYRMRVYVPYGTEWYPYFSRRIAERPANALFVVRQLVSG
jgi:proline dehydrogenase